MDNTELIYEKCGIKKEVFRFGERIEKELEERFSGYDRIAEYNQLKVVHAMQSCKVSEACFMPSSGYGYNDLGRETLEKVYAAHPDWKEQPTEENK